MSAVPELRHRKFSGSAIITPMCFVLTRTSPFASRSKIRPRQGLVEISREVNQPKVDTTHLALLSIYKHPISSRARNADRYAVPKYTMRADVMITISKTVFRPQS